MIKKIRVIGRIAVVTATAEFHPLRQLTQIAAELDQLRFCGEVLFDLLAVNGLSENRFASMKFVEHKFHRSTFAVESNISQSIIDEQDSIAKQDQTFLLGSVLSSGELEKFMH